MNTSAVPYQYYDPFGNSMYGNTYSNVVVYPGHSVSSIGYGWSPWSDQTALSVENLNQWDSNLRYAVSSEVAGIRSEILDLKKLVTSLQEELNRTHNSSEEVCGHTQDGCAADDQGGVRAVSPGVTLTFGQGASDYFIR